MELYAVRCGLTELYAFNSRSLLFSPRAYPRRSVHRSYVVQVELYPYGYRRT